MSATETESITSTLRWLVDSCVGCYHERPPRRLAPALASAVTPKGRGPGYWVTSEHRCVCGHEWTTTWDLGVALAVARDNRDGVLASEHCLVLSPAEVRA